MGFHKTGLGKSLGVVPSEQDKPQPKAASPKEDPKVEQNTKPQPKDR